MIRITARRHSDGLEISAVGHADFAERGRDIVCAGVSALLFGFLSYLKATLSVATAEDGAEAYGAVIGSSGDCNGRACTRSSPRGEMEYRTGDGTLWVRTHGMDSIDTTAWAVTAAGLALIAEQYPDHVRSETRKE